MVPPAIDRHRVFSSSHTAASTSASGASDPVAVQVDDELGAVLAVAYAEQLGHARLRARPLSAQRAQRRAHAEQRADGRERDRVTDGDLLCGA